MTPNGNRCPLCGNQLAVKVAAQGEVPGSKFLRCNSPHHPGQHYFFRFPTMASHPLPPLPSAPVPIAQAPSETPRPTCRLCPSKTTRQVDSACSRQLCRSHCAEAGPCALGPHQRHRNKILLGQPVAVRGRKPKQPTTAALPPLHLPFPDFADHDEWAVKTRPPPPHLYRPRIDPDRAEKLRYLDTLPGLKSPTPASDDEEDAAQLTLGIRLSSMSNPSRSQPQSSEGAGPSRQPMPSYGPLHLPTSIQQAGRSHEFGLTSSPSPSNDFLRPLSSSPNFPATIPLPDIPSIAPLPMHSPVKKAVATKPLRITTQLNNQWMSSDNDPPSPSTFHIKKGITRRFVVVYWHEEDKGHTTFIIDATPSWPQWRVTDAVGSFAVLLGENPELDLLMPKYKHWAAIDTAYVHQLTPDCVVMLRRRDVNCKNFEDTVSTFYPNNNIMHIRKNLPGERAAVRDMYKDTDSDVKVVEPKKRMKEHDDNELSQSRRQRPRLYIKQEETEQLPLPRRQLPPLRIDVEGCILIDDDDDETPPLTAASSTPSSAVPSPALSSSSLPASSPVPSSSSHRQIRWPATIHVVDMVRGFQLMDSPLLAHLDRQERFKRAFNMPYSASTVSEQRAIYQAATAAEIKRGVDVRWSAAGLWTVWRKQVEAVKQGTRGVTKRGGRTV
ncbi:hypothetical protein DFH08DRAFT_1079821 [Mycena albidolilacea]|uniref:Uncharacterized protein n=1 Tax=Mycena albidolilacea TaxID=1033008 RepID=A0AAD7ES92_9AGAR|nr:hypothetical protein DFH08DRAFT_1079821 [Mycena albidolilacea]